MEVVDAGDEGGGEGGGCDEGEEVDEDGGGSGADAEVDVAGGERWCFHCCYRH